MAFTKLHRLWQNASERDLHFDFSLTVTIEGPREKPVLQVEIGPQQKINRKSTEINISSTPCQLFINQMSTFVQHQQKINLLSHKN